MLIGVEWWKWSHGRMLAQEKEIAVAESKDKERAKELEKREKAQEGYLEKTCRSSMIFILVVHLHWHNCLIANLNP